MAKNTFIVVHDSPDGTTYPTDTQEEIALAIEALRANGEESARVYAGDPDCPDSYWNGQTLYVPPPMKNELSRKIFELGLNAELRGDLEELNLFVAIERYILNQIESNRES